MIDIRDQCSGKWQDILLKIGIDKKFLSGKHSSCFFCKDEHKNARFNLKQDYYICSKCHVHSCIDMAMIHLGIGYKETCSYIRDMIGAGNIKMNEIKNDSDKSRKRLKDIHSKLVPIKEGSPGYKYLKSRGINVIPRVNAYEHPGYPYFEQLADGQWHKVGIFPCLVFAYRNVKGELATYKLIYLTPDGQKAPVEFVKKDMPVISPLKGCYISMFKTIDKKIGVAEGVETALAAYQLTGIPVVAAGNSGNLEDIQLPEQFKEVHIFADNDPSFTGQASAYKLAKRLVMEKRGVVVNLIVDGKIIIDLGTKFDFADHIAKSPRKI